MRSAKMKHFIHFALFTLAEWRHLPFDNRAARLWLIVPGLTIYKLYVCISSVSQFTSPTACC